jgi:hypothetical protein
MPLTSGVSAYDLALIAVMDKDLLTDAERGHLANLRSQATNDHIRAKIDALLEP